MNQIKEFSQFVDSIVPMTKEDWRLAESLFTELHISKGQCFLREGEVPERLAYIQSGLFKAYYLDNKGNEHIRSFIPEKHFLLSYSPMIRKSPSFATMEALEDSRLLVLSYESLKKLEKNSYNWLLFIKKILDIVIEKKEMREWDFLLHNAEQRYEVFRKKYPGLEQRVKQYQVASYLGITPVALSRLKNKIENS